MIMGRAALPFAIAVGLALAAPACGSGDSGSGSGGTSTGGTDGGSTGGSNTGGAGIGGASGGGSGGTGTGGAAGSSGAAGSAGSGGSAGLDCAKFSGVSAEGACSSYADAYCKLVTQCMSSFYDLFGWSGESQCVARIHLACLDTLAAPGMGLKPEYFAAYADWFSSLTCSATYDWALQSSSTDVPAGCGGPGSVADGKNCFDDQQCAGTSCLIPDNAVCGTCVTPAVGSACNTSSDCGDSFDCSGGKCQARAAIGEQCSGTSSCVKNAYCDSAGTCAAKLAAGGTCTSDTACQSSLVCGAGGACKKPTLGALGASCELSEARSCNVYAGLRCDVSSKTCVTETWPVVGEACGTFVVDGGTSNIPFCSGGARCVVDQSTGQGTCMAPIADGLACSSTAGPPCINPAECVGGVCTLPNSTSCPAN
jgi:hypothetical protein